MQMAIATTTGRADIATKRNGATSFRSSPFEATDRCRSESSSEHRSDRRNRVIVSGVVLAPHADHDFFQNARHRKESQNQASARCSPEVEKTTVWPGRQLWTGCAPTRAQRPSTLASSGCTQSPSMTTSQSWPGCTAPWKGCQGASITHQHGGAVPTSNEPAPRALRAAPWRTRSAAGN